MHFRGGKILRHILTILTLLVMIRSSRSSMRLHGAGASFPATVYRSWGLYYQTHRIDFMTVRMTYDSIGSGGGKDAITQQKEDLNIDYAGSDSLLVEDQYEEFPDLQMFPTMAGAVVMGYNLPDVTDLVLTRHHIVGFYNGSITNWNDSSIRDHNPGVDLPDQDIFVIARSDKSGTTEIFTKTLAAIDENWNQTYGYFTKGVDDDDRPIYWNESAVDDFGYTNRGVAGLLLSIKYSVAYMSVAEAQDAKISFASIVNRYGNIARPTTGSIQDAMNTKLEQFTDRFTLDLVDADGAASYPIVGYTYMILRMDAFKNCEKAVQLYRYIEWFTSHRVAKRECENYHMTPVRYTQVLKLKGLKRRIQHMVLNHMECRGKNVSRLVAAQKYEEWLSTQTWRLPVFIASPIALLLISAILSFLAYQQLKLNRAIWRKEYMIDAGNIQLLMKRQLLQSTKSLNSNNSRNAISTGLAGATGSRLSTRMHEIGTFAPLLMAVYKEEEVFLQWMDLKPNQLKTESKRALLWMRDKVHHLNVLTFYGLTTYADKTHIVNQFCHKGILQDILQNDNFNLDINFKYSMSSDLASGLKYLHKQGIVHGRLSSTVCLIDARWTVKISDWERYYLSTLQRDKKLLGQSNLGFSSPDENMSSRAMYWTAPEVIKTNQLPTESSDVYSLGIMIVEIFTREDPYDEITQTMEPGEVLERIINNGLRPALPLEIPDILHQVLESCWSSEPKTRPSLAVVLSTLNRAKPSKKSVLDCMMTAVENYAVHLEDQVNERTFELKKTMQKLEELLHQMLPQSVAEKLSHGQAVSPEFYDSVTIFFSDIVGFTNLSSESSPLEIVTMLNDLYTAFDSVIDAHEVYKVETIGDAYMVISGCPTRNGDKHAEQIAKMAIDFANRSSTFVVKHRPETQLQLRIGIHTGPVAAGVVGLKMPRYCLFGDTVNTASRMESTSAGQKIQLSEVTKSLLDTTDAFICVLRGEISVKGKGTMKTYWLHGFANRSVLLHRDFLRDYQ